MNRVTVLTDFGTADGYAAAMAGVIAERAPGTVVDTASHQIPPGDILSAAITLSRYWRLYPEGTVHLVVVDPGVGTSRAPIAATMDRRHFIAPDNGVLTLARRAATSCRVRRIERPELLEGASPTFHGRDVFAPAAGMLAAGVPLEELGPSHEEIVTLEIPEPECVGRGVRGVVLQVDRFGNLITNIPERMLEPGGVVRVGEAEVGPLRRTYGDVASGEVLALVGSVGLLEVSVRDGSAADRLRAERGAAVDYGA